MGSDIRAARNPLPRCGVVFAAGEISRAHVDVIVRTVEKISEEQRYREVPKLPEFDTGDGGTVTVIEAVDAFFAVRARQYDSYQLSCLAKALLAALNPDADDGFDPNAYDRRALTHARDESGMWCGTFNLDAVNGAAFATAIDHFSAPHPVRKEQAEDGTTVEIKDTRTPAQRRADAVGLIARLAMTAAEAGTKGGEPPRIVLYTGVEDYAETHCTDPTHTHDNPAPTRVPESRAPEPRAPGFTSSQAVPSGPAAVDASETGPAESADSAPDSRPPAPGARGAGRAFRGRVHGATDTHLGAIGPALLKRFFCDSVLQVALMHPTGAVLDLGRDARTISAAQRRALTARDRGCVIPGCSAPAAWCDGHHVKFWSSGGLTNLDELALLCGAHHTAVHLGLWSLKMIDGVPWARPSWNIDPLQRWIRNTFHEDIDIARGLGAQMRLDLTADDPPERDPPPIDPG